MEIDPVRWEQVQRLFHEALALAEDERLPFLESACDDPQLREEVLALLTEDARGDSPLDRALPRLAHDVFAGASPVDRSIGPYRVLDVLGEGGMGVVYLAERSDVGNRVALKVLRDSWVSPARRERFVLEQRLLAKLVHPGIAQFNDAATLEDGTPYFVMEYVSGTFLTEYCRRHRHGLMDRLRLFADVCEAVQFAHRHAIIHRDLKPSNVLVTDQGAVKLLDFGISKQLENIDGSADQTQTAIRMMTPAYAAPEQFRGEPVGVYTDVFSLGVILYELLTDRLPFPPERRTKLLQAGTILDETPARPSALRRGRTVGGDSIPDSDTLGRSAWADLDVLCLTAMHADPLRRYRTVEALLRDLEHFRRGEPLEARPDTLGYRATKYLRRNRRGIAAAGIAAATLVGLVSFYTMQLAGERTRAQVEAAKARQVSEYLIGLFQAGDPFTAPDSLDVQTLLARGVERAESLADQPDVQAQMLTVLGKVYTTISDYDRAGPLLRRALALRRDHDAAPADLAETLAELSAYHRFRGSYDSAEVLVREAVALRERTTPAAHVDLAAALDELGMVLTNQGRFEEGSEVHQRVLRMRQELLGPTHQLVAHSLNNLAVSLANQGDYPEAERYLRESLAVVRANADPDNPTWASDLANLGVVLQIQGNFAGADSALSEALSIQRARLGDAHYETALTLTRLGQVRRLMGDTEAAEAYLREAMEIEERILDAGHRNRAITRVMLARVLQNRGAFDEAETLVRQAIPILHASVGDAHEMTGSAYCALGELIARRGRYADSLREIGRCLAILREALPPDHDILATSRGLYGEVLTRLSRFEEAETELLESLEGLRAHFGDKHPDVRTAGQRLVRLYESWNRPEHAEPYRRYGAM